MKMVPVPGASSSFGGIEKEYTKYITEDEHRSNRITQWIYQIRRNEKILAERPGLTEDDIAFLIDNNQFCQDNIAKVWLEMEDPSLVLESYLKRIEGHEPTPSLVAAFTPPEMTRDADAEAASES